MLLRAQDDERSVARDDATTPEAGKQTTNGIVHIYLNLHQTITARTSTGIIKGTITYIYDAAGNKLKKVTDAYPPVSTRQESSF